MSNGDEKIINGNTDDLVREIYFAMFGKIGDRTKKGVYTQVSEIMEQLNGDTRNKGLVQQVNEINEFINQLRFTLTFAKWVAGFFGLTSLVSIIGLLKLVGWI